MEPRGTPPLLPAYNECNYALNGSTVQPEAAWFDVFAGAAHNTAARFVVATTASLQLALVALPPRTRLGAAAHAAAEVLLAVMPSSAPVDVTAGKTAYALAPGTALLIPRATAYVVRSREGGAHMLEVASTQLYDAHLYQDEDEADADAADDAGAAGAGGTPVVIPFLSAAAGAGAFRTVVATTRTLQCAFMTLVYGETTGAEVHSMTEQAFIVVPRPSGPRTACAFEINGTKVARNEGDLMLVTRHTRHTLTGTSNDPVCLFTVYSLPRHGEHVLQHRASDVEMPRPPAETPTPEEPGVPELQRFDEQLWIDFDRLHERATGAAARAITKISLFARNKGGAESLAARIALVCAAPFAAEARDAGAPNAIASSSDLSFAEIADAVYRDDSRLHRAYDANVPLHSFVDILFTDLATRVGTTRAGVLVEARRDLLLARLRNRYGKSMM